MTPLEWIAIGSILVNAWLWVANEDKADQVETLERKTELLGDIANSNAAEVAQLTEVSKNNGMVTRGLAGDLDQCVKELRNLEATVRIFDNRRKADALAIEELEADLAVSDLDQCVVPDRVVLEIAGDGG